MEDTYSATLSIYKKRKFILGWTILTVIVVWICFYFLPEKPQLQADFLINIASINFSVPQMLTLFKSAELLQKSLNPLKIKLHGNPQKLVDIKAYGKNKSLNTQILFTLKINLPVKQAKIFFKNWLNYIIDYLHSITYKNFKKIQNQFQLQYDFLTNQIEELNLEYKNLLLSSSYLIIKQEVAAQIKSYEETVARFLSIQLEESEIKGELKAIDNISQKFNNSSEVKLLNDKLNNLKEELISISKNGTSFYYKTELDLLKQKIMSFEALNLKYSIKGIKKFDTTISSLKKQLLDKSKLLEKFTLTKADIVSRYNQIKKTLNLMLTEKHSVFPEKIQKHKQLALILSKKEYLKNLIKQKELLIKKSLENYQTVSQKIKKMEKNLDILKKARDKISEKLVLYKTRLKSLNKNNILISSSTTILYNKIDPYLASFIIGAFVFITLAIISAFSDLSRYES